MRSSFRTSLWLWLVVACGASCGAICGASCGAACAGPSQPVSSEPVAAERGPDEAPTIAGSQAEPAGSPSATADLETTTDEAHDAPWRVTHVMNEGTWSMASLAPAGAVMLTHGSVRQAGYDPMGTESFVEARDARFSLRWRVIVPSGASTVVASSDGARVLVLGATESRVLSGRDGHALASLPGASHLGLLDDAGRTIRAIREQGVEVREVDGSSRSFAVPGNAPTTLHAMRTDGECQTIYTEDAAHVTSLASAHDLLAIGASDGSIRLHALDARVDAERRLVRSDLTPRPGGAISPVALAFRARDTLLAVYSDGSIVHWSLARSRPTLTVSGACSAEELRRVTVIPGLPEDEAACGATSIVDLGAERVVLTGGSSARVRAVGGARLAAFPTLHGQGVAVVGDELWLAGTDARIERWSFDGTFRGTHRVGTGWADVVALSREHVAVLGTREGEVHGTEREGAGPTRLFRLRDGASVPGFDDVRGAVRFVGDALAVVTLASGAVAVRELSSGAERLRVSPGVTQDAGLAVPVVAIVAAGEHTVVVGERVHLVTRDAIRDVGAAPPRPNVGVVTEQQASDDGSRLARLVFDPSAFTFVLELHAIDAQGTRLLFARAGVGEHVALRSDGAEVLVSSRGAPAARLDAQSGASLPWPERLARWVGFAGARPCLQSDALDGAIVCLVDGALVRRGPRMIAPTTMAQLGRRTVVHALGAGAYVLDERGRTLAFVGGVAGDGFAITTPEGLVVASEGSHDDELFERDGAFARPLPAEARDPSRWREISGP